MKSIKKKYRIGDKNKFIIFIKVLSIVAIILIISVITHINTYSTEEIKNNKTNSNEVLKIIGIGMQPVGIVEEVITMPQYDIALGKELQKYSWNECMYQNVSYELELALLYRESTFNFNAVNKDGTCKGIGQLKNTTGRTLANILQIKNFDVFNPKHSISCSIYRIKEASEYWRNQGYCEEDVIGLVLISYNKGYAGCRKYIKTHNIYDYQYVNDILNFKTQLETTGTIIN